VPAGNPGRRFRAAGVSIKEPYCEFRCFSKVAINGRRVPDEHPAIPITPSQRAHQAAIAITAGPGAIELPTRGLCSQIRLVPGFAAKKSLEITPKLATIPGCGRNRLGLELVSVLMDWLAPATAKPLLDGEPARFSLFPFPM
jgi:hypothetical protein